MADLITTPDRTRLFLTGGKLAYKPAGTTPVPRVSVAAALSVVEGAVGTLAVSLEFQHTSPVTVSYSALNGSASSGVDFTVPGGSVVIAAGATSATIPVTALTRAGLQGDRTCTITATSAVDGAAQPIALIPGAATATVTITDAPEVQALRVVALASVLEGQPLGFEVRADLPAAAPITFSYTTGGGTAVPGLDYTTVAGSGGTIPAGAQVATFFVPTTLRSGYQPARTVGFTVTAATVPIGTATAVSTIRDTDVLTGNHGYWETLQADPAFQPAMSTTFRNQTEINALSQNSPNLDVTYSPATDTYPAAKDAAKVVIAPWQKTEKVKVQVIAPMSATDMTVSLADLSGNVTKVPTYLNSRGRQVKIGDEIMILTETQPPLDRVTGILTIGQRGAYGTTPVAHAVGERPVVGGSSLDNQVHKPFFTEDGYTYLFTWDVCHTKQWQRSGIGGYKTFMFLSNSLWLEPQNMFPENSNPATGFDLDTHVGWAGRARSYLNTGGNADFTLNPVTIPGRLGPGVTGNQPIEPYADGSTGEFFLVYPDRWIRYWLRIQQRANDYAILDMWIADEQQEARQVYSNVLAEVRGDNWNGTGWGTPRRIKQFEIRFNTSNAFIAEDIATAWPTLGLEAFRDLISYVKNFAVLRWANGSVPSITPYLVKPEAEGS